MTVIGGSGLRGKYDTCEPERENGPRVYGLEASPEFQKIGDRDICKLLRY